jgi:hypothetical protein
MKVCVHVPSAGHVTRLMTQRRRIAFDWVGKGNAPLARVGQRVNVATRTEKVSEDGMH